MQSSKYSIEEENLCRLCGEMQEYIIRVCVEDREDFDALIKRTLGYLNIKLIDNERLPNWICAACHLDAESTDKFLHMVEEGQYKLQKWLESRSKTLNISTVDQVEDKQNSENASLKNYKKLGKNIKKSKSKMKLHNRVHEVFTTAKEAQADNQTTVTDKPSSKYSLRKRKQRKGSPCDSTPYIAIDDLFSDNEKETKCDSSENINPSTLISIKPIAELCAANGASLAGVITVNTDEPQSHMSSKENGMRLVCEYCKDVFKRKLQFLKHLRTHNVSLYQCAQCMTSCETLFELKKHQKLKRHKGKSILAKSIATLSNEISEEKDLSDGSKNTTINIVIDNDGETKSIEKQANAEGESKDNQREQEDLADIPVEIEEIKNVKPTKKNSFKCLKCNKLYSTHYSVLRHHQQVHIGTRAYKCDQCSASFKHGTNLAYHMAKHTGIRNYQCDKCTKAFIQKSELTLHMRTHTGDKPYVCEHCPKAFAHRSNMVAHMRLHSGKLPFKCGTCGADFNSSSHLKAHQQMHLRRAQKAIQSKLNKEVKQEGGLKKTGSKNKKMSLQSPNMEEQKSTSLLRPQKSVIKSVEILPPIKALSTPIINSNELINLIQSNLPPENAASTKQITPLPFECTQCLQRFKLKSTLTKHLRTHTGEKPYRCPYCPRKFSDATNFKRHKALHKTATEQLENVSKQLKSTEKLLKKSLPNSGAVSPTHSIASDPDPDGLEAIERAHERGLSPNSDLCNGDYENDNDDDATILAMLDDVVGESLQHQRLSNTTSPSTSLSLQRPVTSKTSPRLVCISYPNPANPNDNKMTTFYV